MHRNDRSPPLLQVSRLSPHPLGGPSSDQSEAIADKKPLAAAYSKLVRPRSACSASRPTDGTGKPVDIHLNHYGWNRSILCSFRDFHILCWNRRISAWPGLLSVAVTKTALLWWKIKRNVSAFRRFTAKHHAAGSCIAANVAVTSLPWEPKGTRSTLNAALPTKGWH